MNAQPQIIRQSELLNRLVLDPSTAEEVGRVDQLWLNPQSHQVVGFTCKSGFLGSLKQVFRWEQITTIGTDSIIVNKTLEVIEPETPIQKISLIGHEVWTDAGNKVGKIVDYLFNPQTGAIVNYLFVSSGWRGALDGIYLLPVEAIASTGSKRVIVSDAIIQTPQQYAEGLNQKMTQAAELIKEDYKKTQDDLEALKRSAQNIAEQVKDTTETVASIAKEKLSEAKAQRQDPSQPTETVAGIAKEKLSEAKAQRQDPSQPTETVQTIDTTAQLLPNEPPQLPEDTK